MPTAGITRIGFYKQQLAASMVTQSKFKKKIMINGKKHIVHEHQNPNKSYSNLKDLLKTPYLRESFLHF
jgi:hypothetical protein